MIKGILLDYGGTIDSNGVHWGQLLWELYQQFVVPVTNDEFRQAYVHGERTLALQPLVKPDFTFYDVLQVKMREQLNFLRKEGTLPLGFNCDEMATTIAQAGNELAVASVEKAKPVIASLAEKYPLVLVSNFYGNVNAVLKAFRLDHFFQDVIESAVVNVRKPDPRIFSLGADVLNLSPTSCLAIGDSYRKDIAPAKAVGCQTIWLKGEGWEDDPQTPVAADWVIKNFEDVLPIIRALPQ